MVGFQRQEDLRDNLAIPALSTIKKLKPKEVIAAEKHLKVTLGARRRGSQNRYYSSVVPNKQGLWSHTAWV